jgi:hypothetical protein
MRRAVLALHVGKVGVRFEAIASSIGRGSWEIVLGAVHCPIFLVLVAHIGVRVVVLALMVVVVVHFGSRTELTRRFDWCFEEVEEQRQWRFLNPEDAC